MLPPLSDSAWFILWLTGVWACTIAREKQLDGSNPPKGYSLMNINCWVSRFGLMIGKQPAQLAKKAAGFVRIALPGDVGRVAVSRITRSQDLQRAHTSKTLCHALQQTLAQCPGTQCATNGSPWPMHNAPKVTNLTSSLALGKQNQDRQPVPNCSARNHGAQEVSPESRSLANGWERRNLSARVRSDQTA